MDFQAAVDYILGFTDYEKLPGYLYSADNYDLRRMEQLLARVGNPHQKARSIQVVGTKGKGSTAAMIASILSANGYRTALYTSPHLNSIRERIRIDGQLIGEPDFADITGRLRPEIEIINQEMLHGKLTTFEILTTLAFWYFAGEEVDFQVLEAGLGGRLDATNMVNSTVCVITSISYDHTEILGKELVQIAAEKAGIIKEGNTVISSPQDSSVSRVLQDVCRGKKAWLIETDKTTQWQRTAADLRGQSFDLTSNGNRYGLTIPLMGRHQIQNAVSAVAAVEALIRQGYHITRENIAKGLEAVIWPGRLQVLQILPVVIADGAHNADSAKRLCGTIKEDFKYKNLIIVLGMSSDKDISGTIRELAKSPAYFIIARSSHPRAADPAVLFKRAVENGASAETTSDVSSAIKRALELAEKESLVLITGSLFVVGEAIEYFSSENK